MWGGLFSRLARLHGGRRSCDMGAARPGRAVALAGSPAAGGPDGFGPFYRPHLLDLVFIFCRAMKNFVRLVILVLAVLSLVAVWRNLAAYPRTEDAAVRANVAGVAPQVGGSIVRLHVRDNQKVQRGDLLFELDARPYEAEVASARARLELVKLEVRALGDEIAAAEATSATGRLGRNMPHRISSDSSCCWRENMLRPTGCRARERMRRAPRR